MKNKKLKPQKRVIKLIRRNINLGGYRKSNYTIRLFINKNCRITEEFISSLKTDILTPKGLTQGKLLNLGYKIKLYLSPNKILTTKGILVRMGKGKGKIKTRVLYLTKGTPIVELIPLKNKLTNNKLVIKIINNLIKKYTLLSYTLLL